VVKLGGGGEAFHNYDYEPWSQTNLTAIRTDRCGVDWGVNLIFDDHAYWTYVRNIAQDGMAQLNTTAHRPYNYSGFSELACNDGISGCWHSDKGWKQFSGSNVQNADGTCTGPSAHISNAHFRVYGAQNRAMHSYSIWYGDFVYATSHDDFSENCSDSKTGYNTWSEHHVAGDFEAALDDIFGGASYSLLDAIPMYTAQAHGDPPNEIWDYDGYATEIAMPACLSPYC
jgi:hypothetical protein